MSYMNDAQALRVQFIKKLVEHGRSSARAGTRSLVLALKRSLASLVRDSGHILHH